MAIPPGIGVVDPGIGFPFQSIEDKMRTYDFFRPLFKDEQSKSHMEFPAQYMFKDVPDIVDPTVDPVEWTLARMDTYGIDIGIVGLSPDGIRARKDFPDRFRLSAYVDPNRGMDALRDLEQAKADHDVVSAMTFPAGTFPQVAINDKKMYPIFMKCVELGIPICLNGGIAGPRMPSSPQHVEHFDEVCYDFPDLTIVIMHGAEPWTFLAWKLMLKWPGLHYMTSAFAPKHYPRDIIEFANKRGTDKVMYCGYFPAGLTIERQFSELPDVPLREDVWPKFLRENALRVFGITPAPRPAATTAAAGRIE